MRKLLTWLIVLTIMLAGAALADELIVGARVEAGGVTADKLILKTDEPLTASVDESFAIEVYTQSGWGEEAETVASELTIYQVEYAPDGVIILKTDAFAPTAQFTLKYTRPIPTEEPEDDGASGSGGGSSGASADAPREVIRQWTQADVTDVAYAIVDEFQQHVYTGTYLDAEGKEVALDIVYRIYVPENAVGLPMVVTGHGSGESGSDGLAHVTASQIATCWADPAWQAEHPCIVLAPQWPNSDVSNDLELRDKYLEVYNAMLESLRAQYAPGKVYLATLSMGSRLGARYLTLYPDFYDACLMVCGAKQNADLSKLTDTPIWLVHASSDFVNKAADSCAMFNQLVQEAHNPNAHLTILTDAEMGDLFAHASWQKVFGNETYMEWLFAQ